MSEYEPTHAPISSEVQIYSFLLNKKQIRDHEAVTDPEEIAASFGDEEKQRLEEALSKLSVDSMALQVLDLSFGLSSEEPLNLHDIGIRLGLSDERAFQLRGRALWKLSQELFPSDLQ